MRRSDSLPPVSPHFVAFAWRYHRCVPGSLPAAGTHGRGPGELVFRFPSRTCHGGDGRVSQVPEQPSCPCALFFDPGRTEARQAIAACRRGPRLCQQRRLPRAKISRLNRTALGLAVYASQWRVAPPPRKTRFRLLAKLCRAGFVTRRVPMKGFRVRVSSSFLELS